MKKVKIIINDIKFAALKNLVENYPKPAILECNISTRMELKRLVEASNQLLERNQNVIDDVLDDYNRQIKPNRLDIIDAIRIVNITGEPGIVVEVYDNDDVSELIDTACALQDKYTHLIEEKVKQVWRDNPDFDKL